MCYPRANVEALHPYVPGEQPQDSRVVKLNTNENPYPPAPAVLEAVRNVSAEALRRYPPPAARAFRELAASVHGLTPEQVLPTNGGDELLRMVFTAFCEPVGGGGAAASSAQGGGVGLPEPTYSLYEVLAAIHNTPIVRIPRRADFSLADESVDYFNQTGCRLMFLVNPHAPSGRLDSNDVLVDVARRFRGVVVIDEAYVDFAEHDALPLLAPDSGLDNVLLLRTLSKGYSLAGLRFGYGLGHPQLIAALDKVRDSYNTDIIAQHAAMAALRSRDEAMANCRKVIAERARLAGELASRKFQTLPSQTNFLLVTPPDGQAKNLYEALKSRSIFVRYFDQDTLRDKLRISVGMPAQNDALLAAIDALVRA